VEEAGSAERDGYVSQAEQLRAGEIPRDPYRPLLYPLLTAGLSFLTGDAFTAARLISNLAAAALALLAFAFGRRLGGPAAGAWAFALLAVNPNLWTLGQHVSTDMLFAALAAATLLAGLAYLEELRLRTALAAGLALGLAGFTRSNAPFLVPALLAAWVLAPAFRQDWKRRLAHLAAAALAFTLVLLPHWALRQATFGDPFHDENWKNVAWKLYGYPDWSYLDRVPFSGLREVVLRDPGAVTAGGFAELGRFATSGAAQLLGTWGHVLLFLAGAAVALRRRPLPAAWLLGAAGLFLAATAFAFFAWGRLLLILLPLACALSATLAGARLSGVGRRILPALLATLVLLLAVKTFAFRLPAFVARHPYGEVAALRRLDATLPPGAALAGTSPFLGRYLNRPYLDLPDAFGPEIAEPALYYRKIERLLAGSGVAYLVAGEADLRDRPRSLLGDTSPAPWLEPAEPPPGTAPGISIWRVHPGRTRRPPERTDPAPVAPPLSQPF
jgi:4-amino-4-deoxy-L-arabinose transferase-like glycosyltransferase